MEAGPRLLDQVRKQLRKLHCSHRTEQQYLFRARRFILLHGTPHPTDMAAADIEAFLAHLAVDREVSASTQNQALAALLFLCQKVLHVELPRLDGIVRAQWSRHLPKVRQIVDRPILRRGWHSPPGSQRLKWPHRDERPALTKYKDILIFRRNAGHLRQAAATPACHRGAFAPPTACHPGSR